MFMNLIYQKHACALCLILLLGNNFQSSTYNVDQNLHDELKNKEHKIPNSEA